MQLGIDSGFTIAGLIGAIAGTAGSKKSRIAKIGSILMGMGFSMYTTPLASELIGITNEQSKLGIAVVIGYLGIQGIQKLIISKLGKNEDI